MIAPYSEGPLDCNICLIGEAPGEEEERYRKPFVGRAGNYLDRILTQASIVRGSCRIENVLQFRPKGNIITPYINFTTKVPYESESFKKAVIELKERLEECKANIFVPLGNVPLYALTGLTGIIKRRGSILSSTLLPGRKVMPTIHPSAALRQYIFTHFIAHDLIRARKESTFSAIQLMQRNLILSPSMSEVLAYIRECYNRKMIAIDIEVKFGEVSHLSIAISADDAICIPFVEGFKNVWDARQETLIWKSIGDLLYDDNVTKIGQNIVFDFSFLFDKYGIVIRNIEDTMIGSAITTPDFPKGLDFITSIHCDGEPYYKDEGKKWFKNPFGNELDFRRYNAMDSAVCIEAFPKIEDDLRRLGNYDTYKRQVSMIPALVFMGQNGIRMDVEGLKSASIDAGNRLDILNKELKELCGFDINPASSKQVMDYFYIRKGLKPYTKKGKPTSDETALKRIARKGYREAKVLLEIRHLSKLKGTYFDVTLDGDGRFRCSYNPVGTKQGRISSSATISGTGCLSEDTEVLTKHGWERLDNFNPDEHQALIWNCVTSDAYFSNVSKIITTKIDKVIEAESTHHKLLYTLDHNIVTISSKGNIQKKKAEELLYLSEVTIPTSGHYIGGEHSDLVDPRLYAAFLADGSIVSNKIRFQFKKRRKIQRLQALVDASYISLLQEQKCSNIDQRRFALSGTDAILCGVIGKKLGPWILSMSKEWLESFVDESKYWDATIRNNSFIFYTTIPENAKWLATASHLVGKSATINIREDNNRGYGSGNNKPLYSVNVKPRNYIRCTPKKHLKLVDWNKPTYCLRCETGTFFVRRKGSILITGNSNHQNQPPETKRMMLVDDGYIAVSVDLSQGENRVVAYIANEVRMMQAFENHLDVHKLTASLIFNKPIESISDEKGSSSIGGGLFSERFWGKKANHGLNYDLGFKKFALLYEIQEPDARFIVNKYHMNYPGIRQWHSSVREKLSKNRMLTNCFGRTRIFMDRWGDDMFREAYSFNPQSTIADIFNYYGITFFYERQDLFKNAVLMKSVHDSLTFQFPIERGPTNLARCIVALVESLETPVKWQDREFIIPVDVAIGYNLDKFNKEKNPKGLKELDWSSKTGTMLSLSNLISREIV